MIVRVGFLDKDENYIARLANYYSAHANETVQFEIYLFTKEEALRKQLSRGGRMDLLVAEEDLLPEPEEYSRNMELAFWSTEKHEQKRNGYPVVFRYQKASEIFREFQSMAAKRGHGASSFEMQANGQVVLFINGAGGAGSGTAAAGCAAAMAAQGKNTVCFTLKQNACNDSFDICGSSMTDVMYEISMWRQLGGKDQGQLQMKLQSMLKALQEKIEKACEELRALLGLNENDEPLDTTAIFQNAIDGVAADAEYAENERYVIVNDYDGDGKQEAFGFLGIRNDEYQTWESVKLYYLKSDGSVEEIALNGDVTGGPAKVSGAEQMDFSESFITLGNKTFLDFEIGYSASEPTTVLFGVNDGNYTSTSVYGYFPEKVDENHIATSDLDYRVVYKEENGIFTETMRMPGEDYEYRFASKEEYLNSMLTEEQLKDMARGLGVPEDLDVRYIQGERSYWEAGECWEIYVLVCTGNKCIASCSINPDNGEWTRNTAMYDPDHAWEVNC